MKYLLDANAVIAALDGRENVIRRIRNCAVDDIAVSSIVAHELYYGAYKSQRTAKNLAIIDSFGFEVLEFDREDAKIAGAIRAHLALAGAPIGPYDVLIAGQTLARGLTLVSRNTREFRRVPELKLEDWEA
jgi:tRNA(fMet)-specific endonuclease VapC